MLDNLIVTASSANGLAALNELTPRLNLSKAALLIATHIHHDKIVMSLRQQGLNAKYLDLDYELAPGDICIARYGLTGQSDIFNDVPVQIEDRVVIKRVVNNSKRDELDEYLTCIAPSLGFKTIAAVLSGAGIDGAEGLSAIQASGGRTIVQWEPGAINFRTTRTSYGYFTSDMPSHARSKMTPDFTGSINEIAYYINSQTA